MIKTARDVQICVEQLGEGIFLKDKTGKIVAFIICCNSGQVVHIEHQKGISVRTEESPYDQYLGTLLQAYQSYYPQ